MRKRLLEEYEAKCSELIQNLHEVEKAFEEQQLEFAHREQTQLKQASVRLPKLFLNVFRA